jgi:hypothetical protein
MHRTADVRNNTGAIGAILWFFVGVGFMYAIAQLIPDHDHPAMADVEHELVAMSKEDHGDDEIDHEERVCDFALWPGKMQPT